MKIKMYFFWKEINYLFGGWVIPATIGIVTLALTAMWLFEKWA